MPSVVCTEPMGLRPSLHSQCVLLLRALTLLWCFSYVSLALTENGATSRQVHLPALRCSQVTRTSNISQR